MYNIPVKNFGLVWNNGLGVLPVSLFINVEEVEGGSERLPIEYLYKLIADKKHYDVLVKIDDTKYYDGFDWVIGKLILNGFFVSLMVKLNNFKYMAANNFIILAYLDDLRKNTGLSDLVNLSNGNIVIQEENTNKLKLSLNTLNNAELKLKPFFDTEILSQQEVLEAGIYNCFPTSTNFVDTEL